jgi:magnesium chelatase family protein
MEIRAYAPGGYQGTIVTVEVDCRTGIPGLDIVGLPASEVREARERARVAIRNSGFALPPRRILISLTPADLHKSGNGFDLAIALAILQGTGQLPPARLSSVLVTGELRLDGRVAGVRGVLAAVSEAVEAGVCDVIVPRMNLGEARAVKGARSFGIESLDELPACVTGNRTHAVWLPTAASQPETLFRAAGSGGSLSDFSELKGLASLKRMLQVAAAGGHHLLLVGPPGVGKSAALSLFPTIMPPMTQSEAVEVTRIHSLAGELRPSAGLLAARPYREPHHNSTTEGLLGGGNPIAPGEVALAHRGALFLDEALEFRRPVLQGLREPMERGRIALSRAGRRLWFPADFQLLLAANPCPCGMLGRSDRICLCSVSEVERYWKRLGGPLLDRIDLRMTISSAMGDQTSSTEGSAALREQVITAQRRAVERHAAGRGTLYNRSLTGMEARQACKLSPQGEKSMRRVVERLRLSTRAVISVLRVARTIADLADETTVRDEHLLEAAAYRSVGEREPFWSAVALDRVR